MAQKDAIYRCEICGNVVSVIEGHEGTLVCCGKDMIKQVEKTQDNGMEKHVPQITFSEGKATVKIGSIPHPMNEDHYISKIELLKKGKVILSKNLYPDSEPIAQFLVDGREYKARAYCNIHGLWTN